MSASGGGSQLKGCLSARQEWDRAAAAVRIAQPRRPGIVTLRQCSVGGGGSGCVWMMQTLRHDRYCMLGRHVGSQSIGSHSPPGEPDELRVPRHPVIRRALVPLVDLHVCMDGSSVMKKLVWRSGLYATVQRKAARQVRPCHEVNFPHASHAWLKGRPDLCHGLMRGPGLIAGLHLRQRWRQHIVGARLLALGLHRHALRCSIAPVL